MATSSTHSVIHRRTRNTVAGRSRDRMTHARPTRPAPAIRRRLLDSRQPSPPKCLVRLLGLVVVFALSLFAAADGAGAQQVEKVWRVGYLAAGAGSENQTNLNAFRQGLRDLGYVDGQNIAIEYRWGEGKYQQLPKLVDELVKMNVDVIVAANAASAQAAKETTTKIPIVMIGVDPVAVGLVTSLARPGGNITGLSNIRPDLVGKHLELLKEVVPKISRVAALGNPANPGTAPQLQEAKAAAQALGLQL